MLQMNQTSNPVLIALMEDIQRDNPRGSGREHQAALRAKIQAEPALEKQIVDELYCDLIKAGKIKGMD
jgi:hypothetical protein